MQTTRTPLIGRILYWFVGAPVTFLGVLYAGILPVVVLGPAEQRPPMVTAATALYAAVLFVVALWLTWAFWRAVRGDAPPAAFRPFPWPVWAAAVALGFASGISAFFL
jgi:hypothetical protein